jgi:hypothetical protein
MVKTILVRSTQAVTLLFGAFGGALTKLAPPDRDVPDLSVGIASLLSLALLLTIGAMANAWTPAAQTWFRRVLAAVVAIGCAVAIVVGSRYLDDRHQLVKGSPREDPEVYYVAGTEHTTAADSEQRKNPALTDDDLVMKYGGPTKLTRIWTEESIQRASDRLRHEYIAFVLAISLAVFCAAELPISRSSKA